MLQGRLRQIGLFALTVAVIGASAFTSQRIWRENGLRTLQAVNEPRLQLIANEIKSEINRQDHLPIVLSLDSDVRDVLAARNDPARSAPLVDRVNRKLTRIAREADTRGMFIIAPDGVVVASADWEAPETLVGRSLADQPYFTQAVATGSSAYFGVDPATNRVRYFLAQAIHDRGTDGQVDGGTLLGVGVVRIEFDQLEDSWERAAEHVIVTDSDGVVFLTSHSGYRFRGLGLIDSSAPAEHPAIDRYLGAPIENIEAQIVEQRGSDQVVRINDPDGPTNYLSQAISLPEYGWTIHRLVDLTSVNDDRRDGGIIGGSISALLILLMLYLVQRHRAYAEARRSGAELQRQVAERTRELSDANASLHTEIEGHQRTEARLRSTQNELVQAGKLAALGQMSAALAHEINQPLAAIRTFMASTKIFAQRGELAQVVRNLALINDLAERMANITGHLKTFARKSEPGHAEPVSVERSVERAMFLLESQVKTAGVQIEKDIARDLWVMGYAVQLEQVILNLVRNALDAVTGRPGPWIRIKARAADSTVLISVTDNGPGLSPDNIGRIFDPFFTTKPLGKGLGLGLSISYGIVQDFGGQILAANRPDGGAELTVELPRHRREAVALAETAIHA